MTLILALAIAGQTTADDIGRWLAANGLAARPVATRADLEMTAAVEDFARADPPAPIAAMIGRLGSARWPDRDAASEALESAMRANPADARWLFRGRRDPDPEIRLRCNAILRRLAPCPSCRGSGASRNWPEWACSDCQGAATAWPWSMWD